MAGKVGFYLLLLLCISFKAGAIEASASYTVFYMPSEKNKAVLEPYIELYWQINPKSILFSKNEAGLWQGKVITSVVFRDEKGKTVREDKYIMQTTPADTPDAFNRNILELQRYALPAGKLIFTVSLADVAAQGNTYTYTDSVIIKTPANEPFYSGLQILDTIIGNSSKTVFLRNGKQQIPLSFNFLDEDRKKLHVYTELYQSGLVKNGNQPLIQHIAISKKPNEQALPGFLKTDTIKADSILPVLESFDITQLASGNYYLNIVLEDGGKNTLASRSLFFQRSNTLPVAETREDTTGRKFEKVELFDISSTFVSKYNISQLKAILKMLYPISSPLEQKSINTFLKKPQETYMRYFIYNFWSGRNEKEPEKPWAEYTNRVREVNKLFGSGATPGYETDRGIIWLKYGKPEERITVQNEQGVLPYEIWRYNAPGKQSSGGLFLFYRPGFMVTDYRLLHSTVNGEMRNLNWRTLLYATGTSPDNMNSRAEQYIGNK